MRCTTSPSSVCTKREISRLRAGRVADDPRDEIVLGRDIADGHALALRLLRERLEMRLDGGDLGQRRDDRPLDFLRDLVRLVEREPAGKLEVQRDLGARIGRDDADVVHLAHATHAERSCVRALAHLRAIAERLDVHDDVRLGQRRLHCPLDRVRSCVPLSDSGIDGDADHDVGEVAAGGLAHAQAPELDRRADVLDREACRLLRIGGHAVHQARRRCAASA